MKKFRDIAGYVLGEEYKAYCQHTGRFLPFTIK